MPTRSSTPELSAPIIITHKVASHVRIHTFIASYADNNIANATHIIESQKKLVIIDGQFLVPYAKQFRKYADSLEKKPIDRIFLSHRHPDHWFGLGAAFYNNNIYALPETVAFIEKHGKSSVKDHKDAPKTIAIPKAIDKLDDLTIDGVQYCFDKITNTEIDFLLTLRLPELGVYIAQDLIYSGTHLYLTKDMKHWIKVLEKLLLSDYELFLPGHGLPADKNEVARNIEYLAAAQHAIDSGMSKYDFKSFLLQRYPERKCPGIFNIYLPRLFDGARDY